MQVCFQISRGSSDPKKMNSVSMKMHLRGHHPEVDIPESEKNKRGLKGTKKAQDASVSSQHPSIVSTNSTDKAPVHEQIKNGSASTESHETRKRNLVDLEAKYSDSFLGSNIKVESNFWNSANTHESWSEGNIDVRNMNENEEGKNFSCDQCHREFSSSTGLLRHKNFCGVQWNLSCEHCGKKFARAHNLEKHRQIHESSGKSHLCKYCKKEFPNLQVMENHIKYNGCSSYEKPFCCQHCNAKFSLLRNMEYHQLHRCKAVTPNLSTTRYKIKERKSKPGVKERCPRSDPLRMTCEVCGNAVFCTAINDHMQKIHQIKAEKIMTKCPWCEKVVTSKGLLPHAYQFHFYARFPCNQCKFIAYFAYDLVSHVGAEHDDKNEPYNCPICKKLIPLHQLDSHHKECREKKTKIRDRKIRESDQVEKICDTCGKTVKGKRHYKEHLKTHLKQKAIEE